MKQATIAAIVLITGTAFAQTNTQQKLPACTAASYITFDVTSSLQTLPTSGNERGEITGRYQDANFMSHGFVRSPNGTVTTFDPVGSLETDATSINSLGEITGWYLEAIDEQLPNHGFVRSADGTITSFDVPGADRGTIPEIINSSGE